MKKNYFLFLSMIGQIVASPAFANDSTGVMAAGGIQFIKNHAIKMLSEELTISTKKVHVAYLFQNLTDQAVTTTIFFPLPPDDNFGPGAASNWDDEIIKDHFRNTPFRDFSVTVRGKPIAYFIKRQAMLNGRDIAPILIKAGISL